MLKVELITFFLLQIDTSKGVCNDNIAKYPFDPWTTSLKNPINSFLQFESKNKLHVTVYLQGENNQQLEKITGFLVFICNNNIKTKRVLFRIHIDT